jgi:hypothetical protein
MKNHFDPKNILRDRGCSVFETAMRIHDRYVSFNSDSMENAANPNFFKIVNIIPQDENYIIHILENNPTGLANHLHSSAYSFDELVDVFCGGKINCAGKRFNTKEASFETRVRIATEFLAELIGEDKIRQKIANGILKDNSSALLATHWLTQLDSLVGFSEDDVMHVLWCIFINWDGNAEVLKAKFPLEDASLIEKDVAVLEACKEALGIPSAAVEKKPTLDVTSAQINKLIIEINNMFEKLCGQAPLNHEQVICLSDYFGIRAAGDVAAIESHGFLQKLMEINKHMGQFVKTQATKPIYSQMSLFAAAAASDECAKPSHSA